MAECAKCGQVLEECRIVVGDHVRVIHRPCACGLEDYNRVQEDQRRQDLERRWERTGVPVIYRNTRLADFPEGVSGQAKAWLDQAQTRRPVLVVAGPAGVGKTHLACAVLREAVERSAVEHHYETASNFSRRCEAALRSEREGETEYDVMQEAIERYGILLLDDIGAERWSEARKVRLQDVISGRAENLRPVILTTNLVSRDVAEYLGQRLADRLLQYGVMLPLRGASKRRSQRQVVVLPGLE